MATFETTRAHLATEVGDRTHHHRATRKCCNDGKQRIAVDADEGTRHALDVLGFDYDVVGRSTDEP